MGKKLQENSKAAAARERKEAHQATVDAKARQEKEKQEAAEWSVGSRGKSHAELEKEKRAEQLARKQAAAAELAAEESEIAAKSASQSKRSNASGSKSDIGKKKQVPAFLLAGLGGSRGADKVAAKKEQQQREAETLHAPVEELTASNLDDALALLDLTSGGGGAVSTGGKTRVVGGGQIDRHPERRVKAAYAAYEEKWMPILKKENPGLRHTQLKDLLWKQWQKAEENPMNQQHVSYNASQEEIQELAQQAKEEVADRLRKK